MFQNNVATIFNLVIIRTVSFKFYNNFSFSHFHNISSFLLYLKLFLNFFLSHHTFKLSFSLNLYLYLFFFAFITWLYIFFFYLFLPISSFQHLFLFKFTLSISFLYVFLSHFLSITQHSYPAYNLSLSLFLWNSLSFSSKYKYVSPCDDRTHCSE